MIFKGLSVAKSCIRPYNALLKYRYFFIIRILNYNNFVIMKIKTLPPKFKIK